MFMLKLSENYKLLRVDSKQYALDRIEDTHRLPYYIHLRINCAENMNSRTKANKHSLNPSKGPQCFKIATIFKLCHEVFIYEPNPRR